MKLTISENKRYFIDENKQPFFWQADTCWLMLGRMTNEEIDLYLKDRSEKGFNVIQVLVYRDIFEPNTPDVYGNKPLLDLSTCEMNEEWMKRVDYALETAKKYHIYFALLPTWGDKWNEVSNSAGPVIYNEKTGFNYCKYLSDRLGHHENIIWVLGGDSPVTTCEHISIINKMAEGIKSGKSADKLVTFHPRDGYKCKLFNGAEWIDFNGFQSGHVSCNSANWTLIEDYYNNELIRPVLDLEPCYEGCVIQLGKWEVIPTFGNVFDDYDVRKASYRSVFAGGAGITYGSESIRQVLRKDDKLHTPTVEEDKKHTWLEDLSLPGATQLQYLQKLMQDHNFIDSCPAQNLLKPIDRYMGSRWFGEPVTGDFNSNFAVHMRTMYNEKDSIILTYTPIRNQFQIDTSVIKEKNLDIQWFNPQDGKIVLSTTVENTGTYKAISPSFLLDAVLIIKKS